MPNVHGTYRDFRGGRRKTYVTDRFGKPKLCVRVGPRYQANVSLDIAPETCKERDDERVPHSPLMHAKEFLATCSPVHSGMQE